jgi:hypothetical protein
VAAGAGGVGAKELLTFISGLGYYVTRNRTVDRDRCLL